jgi:hypothetical protein
VVLSVVLIVTTLVALIESPAGAAATAQGAEVPEGLDGWDQPVDIEVPEWVESSSAPMELSVGSDLLPEAVFPEAESWDVPVGTGDDTAVTAAVDLAVRPVEMTVWSEPGSSASAPEATEGGGARGGADRRVGP